jgi:hypothetical protein
MGLFDRFFLLVIKKFAFAERLSSLPRLEGNKSKAVVKGEFDDSRQSAHKGISF